MSMLLILCFEIFIKILSPIIEQEALKSVNNYWVNKNTLYSLTSGGHGFNQY